MSETQMRWDVRERINNLKLQISRMTPEQRKKLDMEINEWVGKIQP